MAFPFLVDHVLSELSRLVGAQDATEEQRRNSSTMNDEAEPKQKQCPVVDMSSGESKVQYCKNSIV